MRRAVFVSGVLLSAFSSALHAEVVVNTSMNLNQLQITAGALPVVISGVTASAFTSVFDSDGGTCTATGAVLTGSCFGYDSETTMPASASASQGNASASAGADPVGLTANASSSVNIPGGVNDFAGTNAVGPYGDLSGIFEVMDATTHTVTVNFSAMLAGNQSLFTDSQGLSAYSEAIFNLVANGTTELFYDSPLSIGPSTMLVNPISTTLTNMDSSLMTNTMYSFDAQVDAESLGVNAPEPSYLWPAGSLLLLVGLRRWIRRKRAVQA